MHQPITYMSLKTKYLRDKMKDNFVKEKDKMKFNNMIGLLA